MRRDPGWVLPRCRLIGEGERGRVRVEHVGRDERGETACEDREVDHDYDR